MDKQACPRETQSANAMHFQAMCMCCAKLLQSCPTLFDPMDCSTSGSSVHADYPGKNTGVGCHALLHGIFLTQGLNHIFYISWLVGRFFTTRATWEQYAKVPKLRQSWGGASENRCLQRNSWTPQPGLRTTTLQLFPPLSWHSALHRCPIFCWNLPCRHLKSPGGLSSRPGAAWLLLVNGNWEQMVSGT